MSTLEKTKIKISDFMARSLVTVTPEEPIENAVGVMLQGGFSGLPVINEQGDLVGIISEHDCIRSMLACAYHEETASCGLVRDFMIEQVDSIDIDADIIEVSQRILTERKRRYPVLQEGKLVGQISRRDLMRALMKIIQTS